VRHAAPIELKLDDDEVMKMFSKFSNLKLEVWRTAMAKSIQHVGLVAVSDFMKPHAVAAGEYGRPGGTRRMSRRAGGTKLGILTTRLSKSIMNQYAPASAGSMAGKKEGVHKVLVTQREIVGVKGSRVPYARIHEFGGRAGRNHAAVIPARPYLIPALRKSRRQVNVFFEIAIRKLAEMSGGK